MFYDSGWFGEPRCAARTRMPRLRTLHDLAFVAYCNTAALYPTVV